jgi:hypothetical protein
MSDDPAQNEIAALIRATKYLIFLALILGFSGAAHAERWRHIVTLKDGSVWRCYPPSHTSWGDVVYRCYDTTHAYDYEDAVPLTDESFKSFREQKGLFYTFDLLP